MKILIVEDDPRQADQLKQPFRDNCRVATSYEDAIREVAESQPDIVILDAMFPKRSGKNQVASFMADQFLRSLDELYQAKQDLRPDVILISGDEHAATHFEAVGEWLRCGRLSDVLPKGVGWKFFQAVLAEKVAALIRQRLLRPSLSDAEGAFLSLRSCGIVTCDPMMARVWRRVETAAKSGEHTFVVGEVGAGKEAIIRSIGTMRRRKTLTIKCRASYEAAAAELFGSVKGVFTEVHDKKGAIEEVGNGVLGLDEFCLLPDALQEDLLRTLESETLEYRRLGDNTPRPAQCMFVFADNIDPIEASERKDGKRLIKALASRVARLIIEVPPLRKRRGDIPLLINHFLAIANSKQAKNVEFAKDIYDAFQSANWAFGNIRSLRSVVEQCVLFADRRRYDLKSLIASFEGIERALLEKELGEDLAVSAVQTSGDLFQDMDQLLICLKTDLFGESTYWKELSARNPDSAHYDDQIFSLLRKSLAESDIAWVDNTTRRDSEYTPATLPAIERIQNWLGDLRGLLMSRDAKDPATRLYWLTLLYLVLRDDHRASRQDLMRVLGRGYAQVAKLSDSKNSESLLSLARGMIVAVDEGTRKLMALGETVRVPETMEVSAHI